MYERIMYERIMVYSRKKEDILSLELNSKIIEDKKFSLVLNLNKRKVKV